MALTLYKDISGVSIGGSAIEGVQEISIEETFQKLEASNNGVYDGPVAITQVGRDMIVIITSNDVAFLSIANGDCGVSIVFTGVPVTCGIYADTTQRVYTITKMVMLGDSNSFKQKAYGVYVGRFKQLSGGTTVAV